MTPLEKRPAFRLRLLAEVEAWFDECFGYSAVSRSDLPALVGRLARAWKEIETGVR